MDGSAVASGLTALRAGIEKLDATVTAALKATARASADRIAAHAAQLLRSQTHGTGRTADAIRVLDETDRKQYVVNSPGHPDRPANLPMWLEFGTRYMTAKPHMRPAGDAETERYKTNMVKAAEDAALKALT